jgi:hypothetical protein
MRVWTVGIRCGGDFGGGTRPSPAFAGGEVWHGVFWIPIVKGCATLYKIRTVT